MYNSNDKEEIIRILQGQKKKNTSFVHCMRKDKIGLKLISVWPAQLNIHIIKEYKIMLWGDIINITCT